MADEVQESYVDHDGGEFSAVNVRVVATWSAPTFLENLAIDPAGAIFVSLYSHNRLDRYDPATGRAAPFVDLPATACAFGRAPGDENALYVTTDGGLVAPYEGVVQEAKLLRLEVGKAGWPLIE